LADCTALGVEATSFYEERRKDIADDPTAKHEVSSFDTSR